MEGYEKELWKNIGKDGIGWQGSDNGLVYCLGLVSLTLLKDPNNACIYAYLSSLIVEIIILSKYYIKYLQILTSFVRPNGHPILNVQIVEN